MLTIPCVNQRGVGHSLNALLAHIDESELSPEQIKALRECVYRINILREKGMQA
ncbi:hypothetical protein AIF46_000347 [Salmonella enterica subsp. enterica serovar Bareilly]|uniref:Uncharacterized protein n=1 Tax=Salmonella enterica subsp. enterica serovar Bareilly TaxID=58096 RepID=A0A736VT05_SALET|nr:hypothetical protein [Salmonella enterica subsp. enterica serovar Bareilly]EDR8805007.1 hypothetical protein [Salmonella enterica]EDS0091150.1 hypothetical protein [Salmonella enterica subsp. enterica serovar Java]EEJ2169847.1 hypothetical protein [Salmonella enterica subsp. enterica]EDP9819139.1 hypothetical protein [Salmonella enterica subsp. enterica serovar Bareilly]